jgi:hypothetical protein
MNRRQSRRFIVLGSAKGRGREGRLAELRYATVSGRRRSVGAVERRVRIVDVEAGVDAHLDRGGIKDREAD